VTTHQRTPCHVADSLAMKKPEVLRLSVALHVRSGQRVRLAAANSHMSRRTLTRFLSYVEENGDVHDDLEK